MYSRPLANRTESFLNSRPTSPLKSRSQTPLLLLPSKSIKLGLDLSLSKSQSKATGPGFQIFHDPPSNAVSSTKSCPAEDLANDDKENILQPKVMGLIQQNYTHRRPLANLSIQKFPGYLNSHSQLRRGRQRLSTLYQPQNAQNVSGSLQKFNNIPSFVTPPRNSLNKILHRSGIGATDEEADEVERFLIVKLKEVARRKRALSVGANRGKLHLVKKNQFQINPV